MPELAARALPKTSLITNDIPDLPSVMSRVMSHVMSHVMRSSASTWMVMRCVMSLSAASEVQDAALMSLLTGTG